MNTKTIISFAKDFYWTIPFFLFLMGYQTFNLFYKTHIIQAPYLVGKSLQNSMAILATAKLNARVTKQKEDPDLPEGTVLNQIPQPGQNIKPHQTIFLVTSKHPETIKVPGLRGKFYDEIITYLKDQKIRFQSFFIETTRPEGLCIGQIPQEGQVLKNKTLTLYFAKDSNSCVLFPDFSGVPVEEVKSFLSPYGITPTIFHLRSIWENHTCSHCTVKEQKPLAGSFVNIKKPFAVQLKV